MYISIGILLLFVVFGLVALLILGGLVTLMVYLLQQRARHKAVTQRVRFQIEHGHDLEEQVLWIFTFWSCKEMFI